MSKDFSEEELEDALDSLAAYAATLNNLKYPDERMTWDEFKKKLNIEESLFTEDSIAQVKKELGF
jgi:signal recognition particle subunit SEC65